MLDKKLSVILNRVPVLDNPDNVNKTFKLTDGKIQIKKTDSRLYDNIKYIFVIICLVLLPLIYFAGNLLIGYKDMDWLQLLP